MPEQNVVQQSTPEQTGAPNPNQDLYDIFVSQGIKLASAAGQKMRGKVSIELLGSTLFDIVDRVETEGAKNGVRFGLDVMLHGSNEILGHLIKVSKVDISEEQVKAAVGYATGRWIEKAIKTGKMNPDQLQQMAQQGQESMQQMPGGQQNGILE